MIIYITNPDEKTAKRIAKRLLERKLIGCANIFPIRSMYFWKGKLTDEKEFVLIAKSAKNNYAKIRAEVKRIHPYEIPCIMKIDAEFNPEYAKWLG